MSLSPRPKSTPYALLIGISDYSAYDQSIKVNRGTHDLPAGRNDALAFYRFCRQLGVLPENIHILTSPPLAKVETDGSPPGYVGLATRAEIVKQLKWLAEQLAGPPAGKHPPVGLLAYSGHGDFSSDELALCPTDVRAKEGAGPDADLENVLPFYMMDQILRSGKGPVDNPLSKQGPVESLTVLLDCCFSSEQDAWGPGKRSSLTGRPCKASAHEIPQLGECTLLAARPGEVARLDMFAGREHGALTWALLTVADAWRTASGSKTRELTISRGDLVDRAQMLLGAVSLPQTLMLQGPRSEHGRRFMYRGYLGSVFGKAGGGKGKGGGEGTPLGQMDPDTENNAHYTLYTLTLRYGENEVAARVLSVDEEGRSYVADTEYWDLDEGFLDAWSTANSLEITSTSGTWGSSEPDGWTGSTSSWSTGSRVTWTQATPPSGSLYAAGSGSYDAFAVHIGEASGDPVPQWFINASSAPSQGTYVVPLATSFGTTSQGSETWYGH